MTKQTDFSTVLLLNSSPEEVFKAITNVKGWWSENLNGSTDSLHAEFVYKYQDMHHCTIRIVEFEPFKKIVWHVIDNYFDFTTDAKEWTDSKICFELSPIKDQTHLRFTHIGLTPENECYEACYAGWSNYINGSLFNLITKGRGAPNPVENTMQL